MDVCSVDWPKFFSSLRDVVVALSALGTAYAAIRGINSWRAQRIGQVQLDAALRLVRAAVATRDALKSVRGPMLWANEFPEGYRGGDAQEQSRGTGYVLENRWKSVQRAREELETARVECEAIWGTRVGQAVRDMYVLTNEWAYAAQHHVKRIAHPAPNGPTKVDESQDAILFRYQQEKDDFGARIDNVFEAIEAAVSPALQAFRSS